MSKVTEAFSNSKAFIPFLTAGDPNIEKTRELYSGARKMQAQT